MSRVGSYVVQSLTLNGVQRCLPTISIFTESRESLKDLEIYTLKVLSASCCHEYSEKETLQHIKFIMTDSTSHNLYVINQVAEELGAERVPLNTYMQLNECFLVHIEFKGYFCYKSILCHKVTLDVQLINFLIWSKNNVSFSRYGDFCVFVKSADFKICDVIISIAG